MKIGELVAVQARMKSMSRLTVFGASLMLMACSAADAPLSGGAGNVETPTVMFDLDISTTLSRQASTDNIIFRLGEAWTEADISTVDKNRGGRRKIGLSWSAPKSTKSAIAVACQPGVMGGAKNVAFGTEAIQNEKLNLAKSEALNLSDAANLDISSLHNGDSIVELDTLSENMALCAITLEFSDKDQSIDVSQYFSVSGNSLVLIRANSFRDFLRRQKSKYSEDGLKMQIDAYDFGSDQAWSGRVAVNLFY